MVNCCILCAYQVPLNCLQTAIVGVSGTHGPSYTGLVATTWVPMGDRGPVLSPTRHPKQSQGRQKGFRKSRILKIFQVPLTTLQQQFWGFWGAHGWGYTGLVATTWVPIPSLLIHPGPLPSIDRHITALLPGSACDATPLTPPPPSFCRWLRSFGLRARSSPSSCSRCWACAWTPSEAEDLGGGGRLCSALASWRYSGSAA